MTKTLNAPAAVDSQKVPLHANRFAAAGPLQFAAADPAAADTGKTPIKLRARDGKGINHWYWGLVFHDMAGFSAKETIPLDYCHKDDEILGFLDTFVASPEGLDCSGMLVGFQAGDRVAEIKHKSAAGVPYEASIFFEPQAIEEVLPGAMSEVNGQTVTGPALIIRKWTLRGVAVCPYGADSNTETEFSTRHRGEITVPKQFTRKETPNMATDTTPATTTPETPAVDPRLAYAAELKKFTDKFGAEAGTGFFTAGTSFEAALESHVDALQTKLTERDTKIAELETRLAAVDRGHNAPLNFTDGEQPATPAPSAGNTVNGLRPGLQQFAAGIKLPNAAKK